MGLKEDFEEYAEKAKTSPENTSNEIERDVYGLYEQATVGPVNTSRPAMFNQRDKIFKWDAWKPVEDKLRAGSSFRLFASFPFESLKQRKIAGKKSALAFHLKKTLRKFNALFLLKFILSLCLTRPQPPRRLQSFSHSYRQQPFLEDEETVRRPEHASSLSNENVENDVDERSETPDDRSSCPTTLERQISLNMRYYYR
ncbi:uncharacterized protein LOC111014923 isoform X1 [Momordica charantia]|uniref:Uncharacterized protein LOC111014923 isoform X1 n=1 Tax=Momordica charantia TaxID=3673 RepID=A0A6J1CWF9_MOMCH|nr:uncharacterized protein LOC111014923 isoform X1 [Momordica charantia]